MEDLKKLLHRNYRTWSITQQVSIDQIEYPKLDHCGHCRSKFDILRICNVAIPGVVKTIRNMVEVVHEKRFCKPGNFVQWQIAEALVTNTRLRKSFALTVTKTDSDS